LRKAQPAVLAEQAVPRQKVLAGLGGKLLSPDLSAFTLPHTGESKNNYFITSKKTAIFSLH